ncbi:hypothetical protein FBU30_005084 [Linnemannia zychae]|nr:hypothetical protein FBU30_005084 [Linnemannia zychae]
MCFSTHSSVAFASPATDQPRQQSFVDDNKKLKALVGLPCPGCGATFQIKHPQEPGFLTRIVDEPSHSKDSTVAAKADKKKSEKKKQTIELNVDPKAKKLTNEQYEKYIETLDPKILEEMGFRPSASSSAVKPTEAGAEEGSAELVEEPLLDWKPDTPSKPTRIVCHRCHSLSHHASPLANSSILPSVMFPSPPAPIPKHLETLAQSKSAVVILVVDLVDFPHSLPQPVIQELLMAKKRKNSAATAGMKKEYPITPVILVGNKFDVMPQGTRKHDIFQNIKHYLEHNGLDENVRAIHLVSAKNPAGDEIRMLLKSIRAAWAKARKGNVVLVGAENVGKSQLLNTLIKEGTRWRPNEQQIDRVKFGDQSAERQKKLNKLLGHSINNDAEQSDEEDKEWAAMTGKDSVGADMDQYESLYKRRGQGKLEKYQTTVSNVPGTTLERIKVPLSVLSRPLGASYKEVQTKWLMDTPGIRPSLGHLTSWLTLDELKVTLPKRLLKPTSYTLEEGKSFFLGGLVRIDCLSVGKPAASQALDQDSSAPIRRERGSNPSPKITIFSALPLHKTSTKGADKFLEKNAHGELTVLQPPFGSPERLAAFPGLMPVSSKDIIIVNRAPPPESLDNRPDPYARLGGDSLSFSKPYESSLTRRKREMAELQYFGKYGICDLVFSGIGWVMVSGKFHGEEQAVRLKVWTPQGQGAMIREPSLLPELAAQPVRKTSGGIRQEQKVFMPLTSKQPLMEEDVTLE